MNVNDILADRQHSLFVGRDAELAIAYASMNDPNWQLLHFHGPGGIGKSTLLTFFMSTMQPKKVLHFDGHSGFHKPERFLDKLQESLSISAINPIRMLNQFAEQHSGIILLLDTFEQWTSIEDWLRLEFFTQLSPLVRVITAGRYPLQNQWLRGGWHMLIKNVELMPLASIEVQNYAATRGIQNRAIIDALIRFSLGIPLAMAMACEIIIKQGKTSFLEQTQQDQMIAYLASELTTDIDHPSFIQYLEAAATLWKFNQEVLQAILQEPISAPLFRAFCELPFVHRVDQQWTLHDSVRQWMFIDFRNRKPQAFDTYRRRALEAIREKEAAFPERKSDLVFEKIYLHEDDFVRHLCYQWDDRIIYRMCEDADLAKVKQIYMKNLQSLPSYNTDDIHLDSLIEPLWELESSSFYGLWSERQLVAFSSCIPMTKQTVALLRSNPITAPSTSQYVPDQRQFITALAGSEPYLAQAISGSLARALTKLIDRDASVIMLLPIPEWGPYLTLLGYERIPWADSTSPLGIQYLGYQLDLRAQDLPTNMDRIITMMDRSREDHSASAKQSTIDIRMSIEEALPLVQRILKHYPRIHQVPDLAVAMRVLLKQDHANASAVEIAHQLQTEIHDIIQSLTAGTKEEQRYALILKHAYLKKLGTHELVAEHLNLSVPTYYRYLRAAVRELCYRWVVSK
jgi:hypothetical protein